MSDPSPLHTTAVRVERSLIAAILLFPGSVMNALTSDGLGPEHFYREAYARIWRGAIAVSFRTDEPTAELILEHLDPSQQDRELRSVVTDALAAGPPAAGAIREYGSKVQRFAERRSWLEAAEVLRTGAVGDDQSAVTRALELINRGVTESDTLTSLDLGNQAMSWLEGKESVAIATGFPGLDQKVGGGFRPGDVTALGGWTAHGKSMLVDGFLSHAAIVSGKNVHLYANEMSATDRALRMISDLSGIPFGRLALRGIGDGEWTLILDACKCLPFGFTDCSGWSIDRIARHARAANWDLWALDILHNVEYTDTQGLESGLRTLAATARSTGSHVIAVCHLNEERSKNEMTPAPTLRDLRGSGMIKNICSNVMFIHRDQKKEDDTVVLGDDSTLSFPKARHGVPGSIRVKLDSPRMRFHPPYKATLESPVPVAASEIPF